MKTERLNCVIFIVCSITFILQSVGYLAPAWFVREYVVHHGTKGFHLDGKRFMLIGAESMHTDDQKPDSSLATMDDTIRRSKRSFTHDFDDTQSGHGKGNNAQSGNGNSIPAQIPMLNQAMHNNEQPHEHETPQLNSINSEDGSNAGSPVVHNDNNNKDNKGDNGLTDSNQDVSIDTSIMEHPQNGLNGGNPHDGEDNSHIDLSNLFPDEARTVNKDTEDGVWSTIHNDGINDQLADNFMNIISPTMDLAGSDMTSKEKTMVMKGFVDKKRILHVTAGLWYGRACVNSGDILAISGDGSGTEWCTMYIRMNESSLDNQKDVFEFRIEASLGMGVCLLGMLVASSACCSLSRQGSRMVMSLICMFISGAVMLVPVVHMIVQHQRLNGVFHRHRTWSKFMVHTYVHHDLFDHWSVILCGCGSVLSVISSIVFTIIGCRHQKPSDNRYDISASEKGDIKTEMPVNWARTNKIPVPSSKLSVSEEQDSFEADDSDYHTETKEEDCPSEGIPGEPATIVTAYDADIGNDNETGDENDVIVDDTADDGNTDEMHDVDYFEHVLDDD